jgi:protein-tyrosine kinase
MNTIEQAAKRLEQLRQAGIDISEIAPSESSSVAPHAPALALHTLKPDAAAAMIAKPKANRPASPSPSPTASSSADKRSRTINLDFLRMSRAGLMVPAEPRSQHEEEFRIIKRPLLENIHGHTSVRPHRANLIMVTSAVPGEGKTQTAINLATSMAMELDHTVLLVEADVLRPSALERMGVPAQKGLLDLLAHPQTELADVLLKTNIPKLTLLPAGTASTRATELLASSAMSDLLEELASQYADRVIIFDTPPLLSTTESRVLATHMGQVLMVIEAGTTPTSTIKQAFATVENHPVVLAMLNKYRGPKGTSAYGYYAP